MNTRYCAQSTCGHPTQYTSVKPNFCAKCGSPFSGAFASVAPAVAAPQPIYAPLVQVRPVHPAARPSRSNTFQSVRDQRRQPAQASRVNDDDDHFDDSPADRDAAYAEGMEIAAGLDPASFGIGTSEAPTVVRFGDLTNLRETAAKMSDGDASKKRSGRGKKVQA